MNDIERKLSQKLIGMGVLTHIRGYRYLLTALLYAASNPKGWKIGKDIYPIIIKEYNTTTSKADRAMRYAISLTDTRLTVSTFIASLAEEIRLERI